MTRQWILVAAVVAFTVSVALTPWVFPDPVELWYGPGDVPDVRVGPLQAALMLAASFAVFAVAAWTLGRGISSLAETFGGGQWPAREPFLMTGAVLLLGTAEVWLIAVLGNDRARPWWELFLQLAFLLAVAVGAVARHALFVRRTPSVRPEEER